MGNANFRKSQISDLKNLKTIGGNIYLNIKIKTFGKLTHIGGFLVLGVKAHPKCYKVSDEYLKAHPNGSIDEFIRNYDKITKHEEQNKN